MWCHTNKIAELAKTGFRTLISAKPLTALNDDLLQDKVQMCFGFIIYLERLGKDCDYVFKGEKSL